VPRRMKPALRTAARRPAPRFSEARGIRGESCKCSAESLRLAFEPLRQFLIAFRNFMHYPLVFRIAQILGHSQCFFTAFTQFSGQNEELASFRHWWSPSTILMNERQPTPHRRGRMAAWSSATVMLRSALPLHRPRRLPPIALQACRICNLYTHFLSAIKKCFNVTCIGSCKCRAALDSRPLTALAART
jgi:hypothetical protein